MTMLDSAGQIKPLVERLRQIAQEGREIIEPWQLDPYLYDEAADEIERLRAALQYCYLYSTTTPHVAERARVALGINEQREQSDGNA